MQSTVPSNTSLQSWEDQQQNESLAIYVRVHCLALQQHIVMQFLQQQHQHQSQAQQQQQQPAMGFLEQRVQQQQQAVIGSLQLLQKQAQQQQQAVMGFLQQLQQQIQLQQKTVIGLLANSATENSANSAKAGSDAIIGFSQRQQAVIGFLQQKQQQLAQQQQQLHNNDASSAEVSITSSNYGESARNANPGPNNASLQSSEIQQQNVGLGGG
ncbi:probable basic-leucine zipper transcription factor Q [Citrus clementina]|uniref:probable basic-leucine zipper transcription factor Q n=1 Tax=Citrus clementina TaxID=85681 RepID=UPI000CED6D40|nr:probable basic-leucine zipper transcription factor Q [Citrus x clementina]